MRSLALALIALGFTTGCAGNVADYVGPRAPIITPQLTRYGLDPDLTQCVGLRLGNSLTPLQLRRFARQAGAVRQSYFGGTSLTVRDLSYVASRMPDPKIATELGSALQACPGSATTAADNRPADGTSQGPEPAAPRGPTWLNLGAATTGQAIAVDASSLQPDGNFRTAWFRLTNPGANASTGITYLLRIDCAARTISPQADRRQDQQGNITEEREYTPEERGPLPIEGGTVMEIAFLSLCTAA